MEMEQLRPGDTLHAMDGSAAPLYGGHNALVLDVGAGGVSVFSSGRAGVYAWDNTRPEVGGRGWDVYRTELPLDMEDVTALAASSAREGGLGQYFGNLGGNVCSSTVAHALEIGNGQIRFHRAFLNLVTPREIAKTLGPPVGYVYIRERARGAGGP
jgi:hypothetical protein